MHQASRWWEIVRNQMPAARKWAYFDHAAVSPLPEPARQEVLSWVNHFCEDGVVNWSEWRRRIEKLRHLAAQRLNASASEIALIRNTTEGISLIAEGFAWSPGDNVVVPDSEFPSNLYPWMNLKDRGVEVRQVPCPNGRLDPGQIRRYCDERTRVIALSWVGYASGWRADLSALCEIAHSRGALLFVDAIQGLGVLHLDVSDVRIDALAADGHKWLLGPEGAGLLYVRESWLDRLRPLGVGWNSVEQAGNFDDTSLRVKRDASRYEGGTHNMVGFLGLAASMRLFQDVPGPQIEQRLRDVTGLCCEQLQKKGVRIVSDRSDLHWSGIIAVDVGERDPKAVQAKCLRQKVVVNCRGGMLRLSPHVYTSGDDIEQLASAVQSA